MSCSHQHKRILYCVNNHLIFEELPERFYELELQILGQTSNIVMTLDSVTVFLTTAWWWAALNHIRVQCALQVKRRRSPNCL